MISLSITMDPNDFYCSSVKVCVLPVLQTSIHAVSSTHTGRCSRAAVICKNMFVAKHLSRVHCHVIQSTSMMICDTNMLSTRNPSNIYCTIYIVVGSDEKSLTLKFQKKQKIPTC